MQAQAQAQHSLGGRCACAPSHSSNGSLFFRFSHRHSSMGALALVLAWPTHTTATSSQLIENNVIVPKTYTKPRHASLFSFAFKFRDFSCFYSTFYSDFRVHDLGTSKCLSRRGKMALTSDFNLSWVFLRSLN